MATTPDGGNLKKIWSKGERTSQEKYPSRHKTRTMGGRTSPVRLGIHEPQIHIIFSDSSHHPPPHQRAHEPQSPERTWKTKTKGLDIT